jgi:hypothetical protein
MSKRYVVVRKVTVGGGVSCIYVSAISDTGFCSHKKEAMPFKKAQANAVVRAMQATEDLYYKEYRVEYYKEEVHYAIQFVD